MKRKRSKKLFHQRQMNQITLTNKSGLYSKFLRRLKEAELSISPMSKKSYIPFPTIFEKVCRGFSIHKQEAWECLFLLRDVGFIEIIKFKGIKLCYKVKNE